MVVVGNETVAEDTLADGEWKVEVADVELADIKEAPAEHELDPELDAGVVDMSQSSQL